MGKLQLYLSHSTQDHAFAERLAWALRGAGANVWFDGHVQDGSLPASATFYEVRDHHVLVLVLSSAALASKWVRTEFTWFLSSYRNSQDNQEHLLLRLRSLDVRLATLYYEGRTYTQRHIVPVLIDPLSLADLAGEWQPLSQFEWIARSNNRPYSEDEATQQTLQRVAGYVPEGSMHDALAEVMLAWNEYLPAPRAVQPQLSREDILALLPEPLETESDLSTLAERGRKASLAESAENEPRTAPAVWCLVATVADLQPPEVGGQGLQHGTKHFTPGTKVYCFPGQWGDGYERIQVVGRHRDSQRYVTMIVPAKRLTGWHADLVYSPYVIRRLEGEWDGTLASKRAAEKLAKMCRERDAARSAAGHEG